MSQFRSHYPRKVDDAIRTAVAEGVATGKILARLRAGTLDGLDGRQVDMPERTFYTKLREAKRRLAQEPKQKGKGEGVLERLARELMEVEALAEQGKSPEEIAQTTGRLLSDVLKDLKRPGEEVSAAERAEVEAGLRPPPSWMRRPRVSRPLDRP
jgi:hypothetical protein